MSTQRYISTSFWDDQWVQCLNLEEKAFYLYLMTNTLTNIAGVYKITDRRISFDTGLSENRVNEIMCKFQKSKKVYRNNEYIILPNWPKHQKWESHAKIKAGIDAILKTLTKDMLIFLKEKGYLYPIDIPNDSLSKPIEAYSGLSSVETDPVYPSDYSDLNIDLNSNTDINTDPPSGGFSFSESSQKESNPPELIPDKLPETKENAGRIFEEVRKFWNEHKPLPECRDLIIPGTEIGDVLRTLQHYTLSEIKNAIENYHWHKTGECGTEYIDPPPYGRLYGFLKTGVASYFDDETFKAQYKKKGGASGSKK